MTLEKCKKIIKSFLEEDPGCRVSADIAIRKELAGLRIFETPLIGIADAADPLFLSLKDDKVVRSDYRTPREWLSTACAVISVFLPFTEEIRASNREDPRDPSDEWRHARIEGQEIIVKAADRLRKAFEEEGFRTVYPAANPAFNIRDRRANWSERHTAFVCGLGTFGMSRGIITEKGMAGRLFSLITECPLAITKRPYEDVYEYCAKCGKCADNCPAGAIDISKPLNKAKDNSLCGQYLDTTHRIDKAGEKHKERFGCGKCQVSAPCESKIPVPNDAESKVGRFEALTQNLIDQIKEAQLKLGYAKETTRFYYTLSSLNALLNTDYADVKTIAEALCNEAYFADTVLGPVTFSTHEDRIEARISPVGAEYVHEKVRTPAFLKDLIDLFTVNHHRGIAEIEAVFAKYSDNYHLEKVNPELGFDYVLYFDDSRIDPYYYCVKMEMGHTIYHRFAKADNMALLNSAE